MWLGIWYLLNILLMRYSKRYILIVLALSQNACRELSHDLAFVEHFLDCYRGETASGKVCTLSTRLCG